MAEITWKTKEEIEKELEEEIKNQPKSELEILKERLTAIQLAMDEMIMEGSLK